MTTVAVPIPASSDVAAHRERAAAYRSEVPAVREAMLGLVERFAALCDEARALTSAATELDARSTALACEARGRLEPDPGLPNVVEDVVAELRRQDADLGMHLTRLWHGALRGRRAAGKELFELFDAVERARR